MQNNKSYTQFNTIVKILWSISIIELSGSGWSDILLLLLVIKMSDDQSKTEKTDVTTKAIADAITYKTSLSCSPIEIWEVVMYG